MMFVWTLQDAVGAVVLASIGTGCLGFILYAALRQAIRAIRREVVRMAAPKKKGGGGC